MDIEKDLVGELELHVKFQVFQLKASKENVTEHQLLSVLEELGNSVTKHDTDDLLEQVKVDVSGKDRTKIGGDMILQVKYMGNWLMKVQGKCSLAGWKEKVIELIQYLQRTHDKIRLGEDTPFIPVFDEKIFKGDSFD